MPEPFQPSVFGPRRVAVVAIVVMLLAQAAFGIATAARLTVTHDEYWHIPVGLLNWKTGRFDFEPLNPPLIRLWATAPLLLTSANSPRTEPTSDLTRFGDEFLAANPDAFDRWVVISRCSIVVLTVLSGALLARWAWEWHGPASACLVAWLWTRCPNILAHGSLVTTDLGGTMFWIAALYFVWRFAQRPTPRRAIIAGAVLGLAQAAKFTCVLLAPLVISLWLLERWRNVDVEPLNRRAAIVRWLVLAFVALVSLNAAYLFHGTGSSLRSFDFASNSARAWQKRLGPLAALPVPLPKDYVVGVDRQKAIMESKHPVFLDMAWSETGFPHYYLMTLVYKLPHSTQLLFLVAASCQLAAWWRTRRQAGSLTLRFWRRGLWTLIPAAVLVLVASTSGMQLGIRYILPALPLLYLFVSEVAATWTWPRHRWTAGSVIVLLAVFDPWHVHPEYLAYFNEAAGGTVGGRFHLLDSNLDWGQDLHELKGFLDEHRIERIGLAYFGTLPPEALGIRYTAPPGRAPQPGWYAVSANLVMGRPSPVRDGHGTTRTFDIGELAYFGAFEPKHRLGASLDVYHVTDEDVRRWHELTRH